MSESYGRTICEWSDKLPRDCQDTADAILVAAARAGAEQRDLAELAAEMYARSLPDTRNDGPDETFDDRKLHVATTFDGAGVISGDLTPECAAVVTATGRRSCTATAPRREPDSPGYVPLATGEEATAVPSAVYDLQNPDEKKAHVLLELSSLDPGCELIGTM
jgi:hypothetical protein